MLSNEGLCYLQLTFQYITRVIKLLSYAYLEQKKSRCGKMLTKGEGSMVMA